jgi:hypothetical protein
MAATVSVSPSSRLWRMTMLLSRGDCSDRPAQRPGIQLAPAPAARRRSPQRGRAGIPAARRFKPVPRSRPPRVAGACHFVVELQLKLEFSSICGYGRLRSGAARCEGTAASYHQSREARPMANRQLRPLLLKFNRPQPVRRILRSQTGCGPSSRLVAGLTRPPRSSNIRRFPRG